MIRVGVGSLIYNFWSLCTITASKQGLAWLLMRFCIADFAGHFFVWWDGESYLMGPNIIQFTSDSISDIRKRLNDFADESIQVES